MTVFRSNSNGANGNTFDRQGRLYTCEYRSRRVTRTLKSGKIEVLAETWEGKRFNAPNDIIVRRDGHVYFTDPLFTPLEKRDLDFYGVYHIAPNGKIEIVAKPKGRPNGMPSWGGRIPEYQVWQIVAFVASLNNKQPKSVIPPRQDTIEQNPQTLQNKVQGVTR